MLKHLKKLSLMVVAFGILTGSIALAAGPVQAQSESQTSPLIAQSDPTDPDAPTDPADPADPDAPVDPDAPPADGETTVDPDAVPTPEPTCASSVNAIGWLVCPVIEMTFAGFNWMVESVLADGFLRIDILDDSEEQLRAAWSGFRTIANLLFVIAFFVIIYAEASGRIGMLETYSVTRLLPKAAVSVIGIQLSFFICAYLIGLFNDLGEGVTRLVLAPVEGFSQFELSFTDFGDGRFFGLPVGAIGEGFVDSFITIAAVAVVGWIAYIVFQSVLVFALLGLALLFFTLILRKVLIVALVVVSPIAFAAWVLPGTDRVFKLWWDSFIKALAMYPLIMLFIASGQLVGRLAVAGEASFIDSMVSMIATFGPLFLIPATFRLAGSAVAAVGNTLRNATESAKGDVRDPNSMRGNLRSRRLQRYGRLLNNEAKTPGRLGFNMPKSLGGRFIGARSLPQIGLMPSSVARAYNRLPNTDSLNGLMADIEKGRETVNRMSSTVGDDVFRATAVTGAGKMKGTVVKTAQGNSQWSGYAQLGTHFMTNTDGSIMTENGIAQIRDKDSLTGRRDAKDGDFYGKDVMSQVNKFSGNRGFFAASAEYAMGKTSNNDYDDQQQIWYGIDGSGWNKSEKSGISQGVWYSQKDQRLNHKFSDWDTFFHDGVHDRHANRRDKLTADPVSGALVKQDQMKTKFRKYMDYVDAELQQYPIQNQKAAFWDDISEGMTKYATVEIQPGMTAKQLDLQRDPAQGVRTIDQLHSLAYKARNMIDQERPVRQGQPQPRGEDGDVEQETVGYGSGATGSAARAAKRFLQQYEANIGEIPGGAPQNLYSEPVFVDD